jgi:hypothetical protein
MVALHFIHGVGLLAREVSYKNGRASSLLTFGGLADRASFPFMVVIFKSAPFVIILP